MQKNLMMQFAFENKKGPFGYPILNGMDIEDSMIISYPVSDGDEIILASDGYPILGSTLDECERVLKRILNDDPMCFRINRSTKGIHQGNVSFDDRGFCRFIV